MALQAAWGALMKIAVVGVGAIGGYVGIRLALAGEDVTFIARGANLQALRSNGLRLQRSDGTEESLPRVNATSDYTEAGPQDVVILAMKAHQVAAVAPDVPRLFGPDTVVVPMQNGIPYWYFHRYAGALAGTQVKSVDPTGGIGANIPGDRVIGCVVYPATELVSHGVIKHVEGTRFPVGELDGTTTERVTRVADSLTRAGLKSPVLDDIRAEICQYPPSRELAAAMMTEAQSVAHKLGITFRVPLEKRIAGAEKVGHHKTSMLQDVEAGRDLEIDALLGAVVELARLTETPTPHLDTVYSLTKLLAKSLQEARVS
jgi:2-dehydropantoate 2-reductase